MLIDFLLDQFAWAVGLGAVRQIWRLVGPRARNFLREYFGAMEDQG